MAPIINATLDTTLTACEILLRKRTDSSPALMNGEVTHSIIIFHFMNMKNYKYLNNDLISK